MRLPLSRIIERENQRRVRRRLLGWGLLAAIPVIAVVVWFAFRPRPVAFAARFRELPVAHGDVTREVRATGRVEAVTTVQVGAEISGRIATVEVDYNAHVKAGQPLAHFDRASLNAQTAQANAMLAASRAALEQAKTDRDRMQVDLGRLERVFEQKGVSKAELDTARAGARVAEQRVAAAQAQLLAQQAVFSLSRTNLDHAVIRAPIDGIVITRNVDPGQTVASMLQTPVLFVVAADLKKMRVIVAVDEADMGELAVGQPASFTVNAYADRIFEGAVTEIRNSPVIVQDVVTYGTVIDVANPNLALKPGMTASVRIRTASAKDVLNVPNAALRFTPPRETKRSDPGVWILKNRALERVPVSPGISDGESTVIAPGALQAGAKVVVELTPEGRKGYADPKP
jgi:HlyD family secretion protein